MNPELDLLLAVARREGDLSAAIRRVSDWDRALELAGIHGLLPMMPTTGLPAPVARQVAVSQMQTHHQNEINAVELVRFSDALDARGVRSVAYKGAVAAMRFYGDIALRAYSDFDVLVNAASLPEVDMVIHALEYTPMMYTTREKAHNRRRGFEESWQALSDAILDLHWEISDAFFPVAMPAAELLNRSIEQELPAGKVRTMSDEDHLIVLATHAARHFFERLEWMKTIGVVMSRRDLDWYAITERVARARCSTAFVAACRIASTLLDYPLPAAVDTIPAQAHDVDAIVSSYARHLILTRLDTWRLFDRRRDAARRAFKMIFEPRVTDTRAIALPHAMRSAYYVLRPLRLAAKHIRLRLKK